MSVTLTFYVKPYDRQWQRRTELRLRRAFDRALETSVIRGGPHDLTYALGRVIDHARSLGWVV